MVDRVIGWLLLVLFSSGSLSVLSLHDDDETRRELLRNSNIFNRFNKGDTTTSEENERTGNLFGSRMFDFINLGDSRCRINFSAERVRCLGGLGLVMHRGTRFTKDCEERCVIVPLFQSDVYECGDCGDYTEAPTVSPTLSPTISAPPSAMPSETPTLSPTLSMQPSQQPSISHQPTITFQPSSQPSASPTFTPTTLAPTSVPTAVPTLSPQYDITLDLPNVPIWGRTAFTQAAARWEDVLRRTELSEERSSQISDRPRSGCSYPSIIDDLYICGKFEDVDGESGVLAFAAPQYTRVGNGLTVSGYMVFDEADIVSVRQDGALQSLIEHEMGHVIGIGTLWDDLFVVGPRNCPYQGINANREYKALTGCSVVPTEQGFGGGTACGHWEEACLEDELMTGFLDDGLNPMSRITIASLEDLGYSVDYSKADSFRSTQINSNCLCNRRLETGDTRYMKGILSNMTESRPRRKLSEETQQKAIEFGKKILMENQKIPLPEPLPGQSQDEPTVRYIGGDVVSVLIRDEDAADGYWGVIVTKDSLR